MPLVKTSSYHSPPFYLFNGHLETIYPAIFRSVKTNFSRERIHTPDNDFLDLDWSKKGSDKLVIISHGLEGDTKRPYIQGMVQTFNHHQYDVLAWNYRSCSEQMNLNLRFYHSGETGDLETVIEHAIGQNIYQKIVLVGFSLGGNITLKYLGEKENNVPEIVKRSVVFSVPLNLYSSCLQISKPANFLYAKRFLKSLKRKIISKSKKRTGLETKGLSKIKTLQAFDDRYTAPLHGFKNAIDYYQKCSSIGFIDNIKIPTLIVNARNDPFLANDCYPYEKIANHTHVFLEVPDKGGHVGFNPKEGKTFWSEKRAVEFAESQ